MVTANYNSDCDYYHDGNSYVFWGLGRAVGAIDVFGVGFDFVRDVLLFCYGFSLALLGEWFYPVMFVVLVLMMIGALTLLRRFYLWVGRQD